MQNYTLRHSLHPVIPAPASEYGAALDLIQGEIYTRGFLIPAFAGMTM